MAIVVLLGFEATVAADLGEALAAEGHEAVVVPRGPNDVGDLGQRPPEILMRDGRLYLHTRATLDDLRAYPPTRRLPVVLIGPARPTQVPAHPGGRQWLPTPALASLRASIARALSWHRDATATAHRRPAA
jgi:hypothetical protein